MEQKIRQDREIGTRLRTLRKRSGLTQAQTAAKLQVMGLPVTRSYYAHLETGEYNIRVSELVGLKLIFRAGYEELFGEIEEELKALL